MFIEKDWKDEQEMEEVGEVEEQKKQVFQEVVGDNTCILCKYVVSTLDSMLEDKANKGEIKVIVLILCSCPFPDLCVLSLYWLVIMMATLLLVLMLLLPLFLSSSCPSYPESPRAAVLRTPSLGD